MTTILIQGEGMLSDIPINKPLENPSSFSI
jgi:hypothetical protein